MQYIFEFYGGNAGFESCLKQKAEKCANATGGSEHSCVLQLNMSFQLYVHSKELLLHTSLF